MKKIEFENLDGGETIFNIKTREVKEVLFIEFSSGDLCVAAPFDKFARLRTSTIDRSSYKEWAIVSPENLPNDILLNLIDARLNRTEELMEKK